MRALSGLSLIYAPHEIIWRITICWAVRPHFLQPETIRLAFSKTWLCRTMGTSSWSEQIYLSLCLFVLPSWLKLFVIREEIYLVWIRWLLLVCKGFSIAGRVAHSANILLKIKTLFTWCHTRDAQLFNETPANYFYDKPLPKYLDPKTVLISLPHPVRHQNR